MASIRMLKIYEAVQNGKRMVSVPSADLAALNIWLFRKGYSRKVNCNGDVCNVLISRKGE